ncbi:sodium:solute symporter [Acinetobacter sp. c1-l78]|uniref:sodium:solute symporter family protein n=1 Tax=Acinetobacter sp. c1-l78 TaxID=3342803 RepID=UPI0035B7D780
MFSTLDTKAILVLALLVLYIVFLSVIAWASSKKITGNNDFLFGSGFGTMLSMFGVAASLFSSFTLQGMPDFFKNHGVAAWVFLGITDVCLAAILLYFGLKMRQFTRFMAFRNQGHAPKNLTELLKQSGLPKWVIIFFVIATTLFMIPYVTIGIKGPAMLMQTAVPWGETHLFWSILIVALMLLTLLMGGLRAVSVTDVVQGMMLMFAVWAIAIFAIHGAGGISQLFQNVANIEPALLSAPGPVGLFNWQFLIVSFISIIVIPFVQPQMATRLLVAKNDKAFARSTMGLCVFAILVILPTLFIGMRAADLSQGTQVTSAANLILNLISHDAPLFFFALFIVGAWAADMSTVDSQLLAIGTEWRSAMLKEDIQDHPTSNIGVKIGGVFVAIVSLILAQTSFQSLILFAINSFVGTSLLLPIVIAASTVCQQRRLALASVSIFSVIVFLLKMFEVLPKNIAGLKIEIYLYILVGTAMAWAYFTDKSVANWRGKVTV